MYYLALGLIGLGICIELGAVWIAQKQSENLSFKILGTGIGTICLGIVLMTFSAGSGLTA